MPIISKMKTLNALTSFYKELDLLTPEADKSSERYDEKVKTILPFSVARNCCLLLLH